MAEFPTYKEMGKKIAEEALDGYIYKGKTLREWVEIVAKQKTGHWIEVTNGRGGHECDVCHDYAPSFQNGDEYLSAFCPNCGADMRGEEA